MFRFRCKCGKILQAEDTHAGRPMKCPGCGIKLRVPENRGVPEAASSTAGTSRKSKRSQSAAGEDSGRKRKRKSSGASSSQPERRRKKSGRRRQQPVDDFEAYVDDSDFASEDDFAMEDDFGSEDYGDYDDYAPAGIPAPKRKKRSGGAKKGKKKEAAAAEDGGIPPKMLYGMFGVAGVMVLVILTVVVRSLMSASWDSGVSNAVPEKFDTWKHELGSLSAMYPKEDGWLIKGGGGSGGLPPWFRIEHEYQDIDIRITGSIGGTAVGDIATAGGNVPVDLGEEVADELDPIAAVHDYQKIKMEADYDKYEETEPEPIDSGCGEGRVSEFTGTSLLSSEYGLRASLLCHQYQYNVVCKCPKKRLEEYKPVFKKIISSVGR